MARPTDYTPELAERICQHIAGGESLRSFCRSPGEPHVATVCRWIIKHDEFKSLYESAKAKRKEISGKSWEVKVRQKPKAMRKLDKDDFDSDRTIYLIGLRDTKFYKIGITNNLSRRVQDIQSSNPFEVEVINTVTGSKSDEYALQSVIEPFWVRGEWFACGEDFAIGLSIIMEAIKNG